MLPAIYGIISPGYKTCFLGSQERDEGCNFMSAAQPSDRDLGDDLLVPDDPAMEQLLTRLGVVWQRRAAVFAPLGGGAAKERGTSALDGHGHAHVHHHHD